MKLKLTPLFILSSVCLFFVACGKSPEQGNPVPAENSNPDSNAQQISTNKPTDHEDILQVAILGDSQSTGGYGQRLSELIRYTSRQRLSYFGAASSGRIAGWINGGFAPIPANAFYGCDAFSDARSCAPAFQAGKRTESIANIIANHPYIDLYILTLGDNHFYDPASVKIELPRLIKPILNTGAKCAFVTPTEGLGQFANKLTLIGNLKSAIDAVQKETGKTCAFIDSYNVGKDVLKNNADLQIMRDSVSTDPMKLHPRGAGAKLWAERVFEKLKDLRLIDSGKNL